MATESLLLCSVGHSEESGAQGRLLEWGTGSAPGGGEQQESLLPRASAQMTAIDRSSF